MNHVPSHIVADNAKPLSRRALAKIRTRQSLVVAAKALFIERGYEDATVRDIARATDLSTGAVFANFADKADLFAAVLAEDGARLAAEMEEAARTAPSTAEALLAVFVRGYAFHLPQLPLLQSARSAAWRDGAFRAEPGADPVRKLIGERLRQAVAAGEFVSGFDADLAASMLCDAYAGNYRLAAFEGWTLDALTARTENQIAMLLAAGRK
jgi:AcrR family transcriptional regulator